MFVLLSFAAQGKICDLVSDIFNINHDYLGNALSALARVNIISRSLSLDWSRLLIDLWILGRSTKCFRRN